jgi:branched-chain amino acid transport system ATP-binding protein
MLAVARALVLNPKLLLLDEPLEGLAPIIVEELLRSIERVVRDEGLSAILVEQNPRLILGMTHRAVVLDRGAIVHESDSATLRAHPEHLERLLSVHAAP